MRNSVAEACSELEQRGLLERLRTDGSDHMIPYVRELLGGCMPMELENLYRERVRSVGGFLAVRPVWNDRVGWRTRDELVTELLHVKAVPIFEDGCGNLFGLDLLPGDMSGGVYFFDHECAFEKPEFAAGSSLSRFLLLLAEHEQAHQEQRGERWELSIDPDLDKCPRAPPIWSAG